MKILRSKKKQNWRRQEQRKEEAIARQAAYDQLSPQDKLLKLRSHRAIKQRKKLKAAIKEFIPKTLANHLVDGGNPS